MPVISTLGAMSSRGFGEFNQQATGKYIEDYFSTWLYTGNGSTQNINNGIGLADTAAWSTIKLRDTTSVGATGRSVSTDSSGNIYVGGTAYDTANYILLAKYNPFGSLQWQRKIFQNTSSNGRVSVDTSGNIYIVGTANNGTDNYAAILKYNSSGALQWQRKLSHPSGLGFTPNGMATDSSSNVYVIGTYGTLSFAVIAKYNSSGVIQWQRRYNVGAVTQEGYGVAVDSSLNVYTVGNNAGFSINKYDSSGAIQWQRFLDASGSGRSVTVDSSNNIYVCGVGDTNKILLARYNSSGVIQWQRTLVDSASANNAGNFITTDSAGSVYLCGTLWDGSSTYMVVAKYNSSGAIQWKRKIQQGGTNGLGITVDTSGNLYATGSANDGVGYFFTVKLSSDGTTTSGSAFVIMSESPATSATSTVSEGANSGTDAAGPAVDAAGTATDSAGTATSSTATQAAVTGGAGLVWIKGRSNSTSHALYDTVRGATKDLRSNGSDAETTQATGLTSFNSNGFTVGSLSSVNGNGSTYTSWTFREEPKFFDIVQYTGNGGTQTINHNLGSTPGMIIVKPVNAIGSWSVYHVSNGNLNVQFLNSTSGRINNPDYWNSQSPTSTVFYTGSQLNSNGTTYIAYLFANSAGAFGPDKNLPGIVCSSFSTNGSGGATISLGFEPQFLLVKSQVNDDGAGWRIYDTIRGMTLSGYKILYANTSDLETVTGSTSSYVAPTSTGALSVAGLSPSESYICMAVRRSPMKVPTDATTVFNPVIYTGNGAANRQVSTTSRPDVTLWASRTRTVYADNYLFDRLRGVASAASGAQGGGFQTNTTAAENANANFQISALNNNSVTFGPSSGSGGFNYSPGLDGVLWNFTRAPGFMDEVCVTAFEDGTLIAHNLGAVPELIFAKNRPTAGGNWMGFANIGGTAYGHALNTTSAFGNLGLTASTYIKSTTIDPIAITNAGGGGQKGSNSPTAIYLFASCPGVSKIGTYSGTGATQTISCGFTGGARYVLIKRTDSTGDWWVWDTARGMVAGTDPRLPYNSTTAEANANWVYTTTGGFQIVTSDATVNASGGTYIFLAIA